MQYITWAAEGTAQGDVYNVSKAFRRLKEYAQVTHRLEGLLLNPPLTAESVEKYYELGGLFLLRTAAYDGSTVLVHRPARYFTGGSDSLQKHDLIRLSCFFYHRLCVDEGYQLNPNGIICIEDMEGVSLGSFIKLYSGVLPPRIFPLKWGHFFVQRQPWYISASMPFIRPFPGQRRSESFHLTG